MIWLPRTTDNSTYFAQFLEIRGIESRLYIQICSELDLARTETRGQGHSDLETVGESPGPR